MVNFESRKSKKRVFVLCDYYLPGYKSGGGMRTIVNMVERLSDRFQFFIITRDHDGKLDRRQYRDVEINSWNTIGKAEVFYLSKDNLKISKLRQLLIEVEPDVIYTNSHFATLTVYLLILKKLLLLLPKVNVILAPCGELADGALQLNAAKKKSLIAAAKVSGLYKNIIWKASTELEKREIEAVKGDDENIFVAPDMLPPTIFENYEPNCKPRKIPGAVKMTFLSRFMKKKNFNWLLKNLRNIEGNLEIDVYGPLEDADYWKESEKLIAALPSNIKVESKGSVPHAEVLDVLVKYHFFIMPTLGENFGHIFLEALAAGCPLIISDRTPWLELENKEIGWDLSLDKPESWMAVLNSCIALNESDYRRLSDKARDFAVQVLADRKNEEDTLTILNYGLQSGLRNAL